MPTHAKLRLTVRARVQGPWPVSVREMTMTITSHLPRNTREDQESASKSEVHLNEENVWKKSTTFSCSHLPMKLELRVFL